MKFKMISLLVSPYFGLSVVAKYDVLKYIVLFVSTEVNSGFVGNNFHHNEHSDNGRFCSTAYPVYINKTYK